MTQSPKRLLAITLAGVGLTALGIHLATLPAPSQPTKAVRAAEGHLLANDAPDPSALPLTTAEPVGAAGDVLFSGIGKLEKGEIISLPLPGGATTQGRLNYVKTHPNQATAAGGQLVDGSGTFEIAREPWGLRGFILQKKQGTAYVYSSASDGKLQVARRPIGEVICEPDPNWKPIAQTNQPDPQKAAIYNGGRSVGIIYEPIPILSSLPRAEATIYLDFDGEVIEGHSWEGGARIVAPAYNLSAAQVTNLWRRVAEDFAPYEVNVTTDLQTYLRAPQGRRIRCITTTNNFASAGGVAFNNTFQESGDPCCWNFYGDNAGAVVISHEVGHTFNLAHDDTKTEGYYGGHGNWGPIMGAPYSKGVCQWSIGSYPNAAQFQDDLAIIGSSTPLKQDDHASTAPSATPLNISGNGSVSSTGVIEGPDDLDAFVFTTGGGTVNLDFNGASSSPNLDIEVKLYNSGGALISTASPNNQLSANLSVSLAAGTYTLTVDGVGNGTWTTQGYDDYGSIGEYTITGTIPLPSWRFRIAANALNGAVVGQLASGTGSSYSILNGNTGNAFSIDSNTGEIKVSNAAEFTTTTAFNLFVVYTVNGNVTTTTVPVNVAPLRGLKEEIFTGLNGNGIAGLTSNSRYPNNPALTRYSPIFQATYNADNFGRKLSGYLLPTETGGYVFWTSADDSSELWLSTDSNSANKVRIAYNVNNTPPGQWTKEGTQQSATINLVAGQRYYIEALHRDQTGADHVAVAWQTPTFSRRLIANEYLEYPGAIPNRAPWLASRTFRIREDSAVSTAVGTLSAGDFEPGAILGNYLITGGNTGNAFTLNATTGILTVNGALSFATLPKYLLDVRVTDNGGLPRTAQIAVEVEPRAVKREYWSGISGTAVSNLTTISNYPNNPTSTSYLPFFETPVNSADNYGQRLTGYVRAPDSGRYTFWIASDDGSELWLSSDTNPANKTRIAYSTGATNSREWGKFATQKSALITLEGGKSYYIEALHKEGIGGDNLAVSWSGPDFGQVMLGTPHVTQAFYNHGGPTLANRTLSVFSVESYVGTLEAVDWADPGTTITYTITGGNADGAFSINPLTGEIRGALSPLPVGNRILTVTATDNGSPPLATTASITVQVLKAALKREVWRDLSGSQALSGLTGSVYFPKTPTETGYASNFKTPTNFADNYGQRVSGHVIPPVSGNYTFWIASDDGGELWLSTDATPVNKKRIASVTGSVGEENWTSQSSQQSITIPLIAGQPYYVEALQKEGAGGDHLAVAWQGPTISRSVISSTYLEYPAILRPGLKREVWNSSSSVAWTRNSQTGKMEWATALLSESFEGIGALSGNAAEAGGSIWGSSSGWARNNGVASKTGNSEAQAFLPFIPQSGKIYTLSLEVDPSNNPGTADWLALGFLNQPATNTSLYTSTGVFSSFGQPWMLLRANGTESGNNIQNFSAGTANALSSFQPINGVGSYDTMAVVLDTRSPNWVSSYYLNGTLTGSHTHTGVLPIKAAGFGGFATAKGNVRNFRLSADESPPASSSSERGTTLTAKGPTEIGDSFSQRLSGYIVPQTTGDYTFWLACDDDGELLLSTDESADNLVSIASVSGFTAAEQWDVSPSQKSQSKSLVAGRRYFVEVRHRDGFFGDHVAVAWEGPGITRRIIANEFLEVPEAPADRSLARREIWSGLPGDNVPDLTNAAIFPGLPALSGALPADGGLVSPTDAADTFGERITAYLVAPEDGRYTFWIASDDSSELWLSTDENASNRVRIATVNGAVAEQGWEAQGNQKSVSIALVAGKRYHLDALHKDGGGGDHLAIAWQGPSFSRRIVPNAVLEHPLVVPGKASLKTELWNGIAGSTVVSLTSNSAFQSGSPSFRGVLARFESASNFGDNYGQRITGRLIAPESGNYKFWIASDGASELWISPDTNPANRMKIAFTNNATASKEWAKYSTQESGAIPLVAGQRYHIEALHKESTLTDHLAVAWQTPSMPRQVIDGRFIEYPGMQPAPVALKREVFTNITGNNVTDLTSKSVYPNSPNQVLTLDSFEAPTNAMDNYGQKISGYLIAPATGTYKFWIASDDGGQLWLATDGVPANKTMIAYTTNATDVKNWTQFPVQESADISLIAGQRCYIETLHKEGGGGDHLAVAWQGPGFSRRVIASDFLEYPGAAPGTSQSGTVIPPSGIDPGYTFWLSFVGLQGNSRLPEADPDGDGIPNSLEFILGGKPSGMGADSIALLPKATFDENWIIFEFRRSDVSATVGPFAQYGSTLNGWARANNGSGGIQIITQDDGFEKGIDRVTVKVPRAGNDKLFFRLNANIR